MSRIRVCFLGTPTFAEIHLQSLLNHELFEVVGVVTQPDRPSGRKMQLTPTPVKLLAEKNNIQILTPENLRIEPEVFEVIKSWQADIAIVVAFGQILSQEFLDHFKFGAVNVHGSLLPLWRGAAPIQRSIEAGDQYTGVSLQKMFRKLDAGPVIAEKKISLDNEINATELYDKLATLGCELMLESLPLYVGGQLKPQLQDENSVTHAAKIEKEESLLNWDLSAIKIHNRVRAFTMGPGTYVVLQGQRIKIHKTKVLTSSASFKASQITELNSEALIIQCAEGQISLLEVQADSKPKMKIQDFIKSSALLNTYKKGDLFV